MTPFQAYIVTALWSTTDSEGTPLDSFYSAEDIEPRTLEKLEKEFNSFIDEARPIIEAAIETGKVKCGPDFDEWGRAAHDFWLTRNRHGAGFWDGDWPEPFATQLTDLARKYGEVDLYVGDDGKIYS